VTSGSARFLLVAAAWALAWADDVIGYIPSPSSNGVTIGSFELHFYGLLIAIGVLVAAWLGQRRWVKLGGFAGTMVPIAFWAVVFGLIGARLYSVVTSWQQDTGGNPVQIVEIWNGGLGIWGGVAGGVFGGWLAARRMHVPLPPLLDVAAPAIPLGQAIGRWGNYFNQELFGLPSKLPWAVRITNQAELGNIYPAKYRPPFVNGQYLPGTFQPTFLYECIWDLVTVGLLLLIERKVRLRRGYLFAAYAAVYTFGRFFTEYLRIDPSHRYLGLRLNDWTSIGVFLCAGAILLLKGRPKPGDELVGEPLPAGLLAAEKARAEQAARRSGQGEAAGAAAAAEGAGPERTAEAGDKATAADGTERAAADAAVGAEVPGTGPPAEAGETADADAPEAAEAADAPENAETAEAAGAPEAAEAAGAAHADSENP
jgi:prolipoprotein diacylglyceryl transferase